MKQMLNKSLLKNVNQSLLNVSEIIYVSVSLTDINEQNLLAQFLYLYSKQNYTFLT